MASPAPASGVWVGQRRSALAAVRAREARRALVRARRQRVLLGVAAAASLVLLALPLHSLAAVTLDGRTTPGAAPAGVAPGSVYVVPQGATLRSVAAAVAGPGRVQQVAAEIAAETGSAHLVPGEHLIVP